jgi:hypothetical protein
VPVGEDVIGAPESFPSPTMSELVQTYEWVATPIGLPATWPRALKTVIDIAISSRQPMFVAWGKELTFLYNDAYAGILGDKHPEALGRPFQQIGRKYGMISDHWSIARCRASLRGLKICR